MKMEATCARREMREVVMSEINANRPEIAEASRKLWNAFSKIWNETLLSKS